MGWICTLIDPQSHETMEIDGFTNPRGGKYAPLSCDAELYVTYNYGVHFRKLNGNKSLPEWLGNLTGAQSCPILCDAITRLGKDVDKNDYYNATEGNARRALKGLLSLALECPDGVWEIE